MKTKVIHAFLWILVCMVLGITCYQCRDLRGYVILSGSMEPVIPTGSVAVVDSSKRDTRQKGMQTQIRIPEPFRQKTFAEHICSAFHIWATDSCGLKTTCF